MRPSSERRPVAGRHLFSAADQGRRFSHRTGSRECCQDHVGEDCQFGCELGQLAGLKAELFAAIDPASACVEEICLLADQLSDLLDACREGEAGIGESIDQRAAA